jgi:hypothetical protein
MFEFRITKRKYLEGFIVTVLVLALVRCIFPSIASDRKLSPDLAAVDVDSTTVEVAQKKAPVVPEKTMKTEKNTETKVAKLNETAEKQQAESKKKEDSIPVPPKNYKNNPFFNDDGTPVKNKIYSVPSYSQTFPDLQEVQYVSAQKWGVRPVQNRAEAEGRKSELVYIGSNPYFYVDNLQRSIPYLVPRASVLLQDIGRSFFDSLQVKGVPLHKIIVTSVLRTEDDVRRLRRINGNASEQSCHRFGTTFDISYNRYHTVSPPDEPARRAVRSDSLKYILCEVLRDARTEGLCYIKYEVKQGCFHITVR